ncbi:hypothetical protein [Spiroplasma endosymbiont of Tipula paludosa]|uniref:hypothetical protein n=1 Tax=Spiroplasma endosymbiont of Tipula paludosa TaxID=3066295 RepID=UPI0035C8DE64
MLGQGLGANIISCLSNKVSVTGIILLNIISNPNYLDSDLKTKFISLYGFWFDRNVKLPVVLVEKLISKNKTYQLQIKKYFENKPFLLWYRLQMNSLINKSYWKLKNSNKKVLLLQKTWYITFNFIYYFDNYFLDEIQMLDKYKDKNEFYSLVGIKCYSYVPSLK